jgi:hypothetical protein
MGGQMTSKIGDTKTDRKTNRRALRPRMTRGFLFVYSLALLGVYNKHKRICYRIGHDVYEMQRCDVGTNPSGISMTLNAYLGRHGPGIEFRMETALMIQGESASYTE